MADFRGAFDVQEEDESYLDGVSQLDYTEQVLFLVDMSEKMFSPVENIDIEEFKNQARISVVMKTIDNILRARIIKSPSDQFGLVFYSAGQQNSPEEFENVHIAMEMSQLDSTTLLEVASYCGERGLERLLQDVNSARNGNGGAEDLKYGLWQAQKMLTTSKNKKISRHMMIFSALNDPCDGQIEFKQQILSKIQSLRNANVKMDVFPLLTKEEESSQESSFWKDVVAVRKEEEQSQQNSIRKIKIKQNKQRKM
eukprot:TRINITY_DN7392_c1_g1_i3.p2 TRINITY_DN7392_c1_g1~~TRINITY_DN7392_c1_g1_i3.p2  ORF type:complete len:254 (+),score=37.81 TRINITY_DN7392_c1_g1_i3:192-953(+)